MVIAVRRDIVGRVVIKAYIDLVNYPYFIVVDMVECGKHIRVVNCYNSMLGPTYIYTRASQYN